MERLTNKIKLKKSMFELERQIVIMIVETHTIGIGICKVFTDAGATVELWDVVDGQSVADEITSKGGNILCQKVDVTSKESSFINRITLHANGGSYPDLNKLNIR